MDVKLSELAGWASGGRVQTPTAKQIWTPRFFALRILHIKKKIMPFSAYFRTKQVQTLNLDEAKNILFDSPESGKPE